MKTSFSLLLLLVSAAAAQQSAVYPDITVLRSDASGITFEYRPVFAGERTITSSEGTFRRPEVRYTVPSGEARPGGADLRVRTVQIGVPSYRNNAVTVESADMENVPSYELPTMPESSGMDSLGASVLRYRKIPAADAGFLPSAIAQIAGVGMVRGSLTAQLQLSPYQYQPSTRTLRRYSRIVVRIDFGAPEVRFTAERNDEWLNGMLLNGAAAQQWTGSVRRQKSAAANSVLSSGSWWKLEVTEEGMYRISATYLKALGVDVASLASIQSVKIFGADGRAIAENPGTVRPSDLPQVAVQYEDNNGNGKFDADDAVLFYGQGPTGWNYTAATTSFSLYTNPYTFSNYYFLTVGAAAPVKTISNISVTTPSGGPLEQVPGKAFFHEEKFNMNYSGQQWFSPPMNAGESRVITNKLNGWVPGSSVTYRFLLYNRANAVGTFTLEESGKFLAAVPIAEVGDAYLDNPESDYAVSSGLRTATTVPVLSDERSMLRVSYASTGSVALGIMDRIEIFYRQKLTAYSDLLQFTSPDTNGVVEFSVSGFSANGVPVYDVTDPGNVRRISTVTGQVLGTFTFKDTLRSGAPRRYWAGTAAKYLAPRSFVKVPNSNLHGAAGAAFLVITHSDFRAAANRLKAHKESLPSGRSLSTMVVDVDTIYNEFGIGMPDPTSLRDFIRYATEQWTVKPKYVLLFGDASFDYRGVLNSGRSFVPTYESWESVNKISTINVEDYFGCLDPSQPNLVTIPVGRLTPRSSDEANIAVDKIINYETALPTGPWKNMVTIVADDRWTPANQYEEQHTLDAETLSSWYTPKDFERDLIYMEAYPEVYTTSGRRKPEVRTALLNRVNTGTLLLNFIGHGNPKVWAHESILTLDDVRTQFQNGDKLTFIVAATCDWARFDEGGETSSAEEVMFNRKGGAIGVLAATRAVYSSWNSETNQRFYHFLFASNPVLRLGDAYLATKNDLPMSGSSLENKQKYFLLGDPSLRLAVPTLNATVDSMRTATGTAADTLRALSTVTVYATVHDTSATIPAVNGSATLTVFDAQRTITIPTVPGFSSTENGAIIYKGESSVTNGRLRATFIVPKDIAYENKQGRISIYLTGNGADGRGYTENFVVGGTSTTALTDSAGPRIDIFLDDLKFRSGDVVTESPTLIVALTDSSGINSSTNGIGHRIEAWIDDGAKSVDLTENYKGKTDSYKEGSASTALSGLSNGSHTVKVRAWDVLNNSSTAEAFFTVASGASLTISDVFNIPNPVRNRTAFTFRQNQPTPVDVTISIYSVAGRLVHRIERSALADRFITIDWDTRDTDGNDVGNGVYLYRVQARTVDSRFSSEATGKMAIIR